MPGTGQRRSFGWSGRPNPMLKYYSSFVCRLWIGGCLFLWLGRTPGMATSKEQFPGESAKWDYYQSPNFELYSSNSESESRDLLLKMEVLRAIFLDRFKLQEKRPLPVTVYYFRSEKMFRGYTPEIYKKNDSFAGFYLARPDRAVILMAPADDEDLAQQVIFHEYIHHLMRVTEQNPPAWYNEGTAEIYSTIKLDHGQVELGHPPVGRVYELQRENLLPLEQIFATTQASTIFTQGKHTGIFYAQSWALLHFCYFGDSGIPHEKFELFLRMARSPQYIDPDKVREICRELLGMDYPKLNQELIRYVHTGQYSYRKFPQPPVAAAQSYAMRAVRAEEIHDRLAELDFRVNTSAQARLALLQQAEQKSADPRPHEVLGAQALMEGDDVRAREIWTRAVALGSENPAVIHELGQLESRQWFSRFDLYFRLPDELATHLRDLLHRSIKVAPHQSSAYEMLAWVEATAKEPQIANVNLVQQHFPELTEKKRSLLALAFVRWRKDDLPAAISILDALAKMEPDEWVQYGAETLRAKIEGRSPQRLIPGGTAVRHPMVTPPRPPQ